MDGRLRVIPVLEISRGDGWSILVFGFTPLLDKAAWQCLLGKNVTLP